MAAKDYHICCAVAHAYIAKTDKKHPYIMLDDRRVITEDEILGLIDWWLNKKLEGKESDTQVITKDGEPIIELKLLKKEEECNSTNTNRKQ